MGNSFVSSETQLTPEVTPTGSASSRAGKNLATFGLSCRMALAMSGGLSSCPRKAMACVHKDDIVTHTSYRGPQEGRTGSRDRNKRERNPF